MSLTGTLHPSPLSWLLNDDDYDSGDNDDVNSDSESLFDNQ